MADQGYDDGAYDDGGGYDASFDDDSEQFEDDAGFDLDAGGDAEGWSAAELNAHLAGVAREAVEPLLQRVGSDLHGAAQAEDARAWQEQQTEEADALEERYSELQSFEPGDAGDRLQDALIEAATEVAQELGAPLTAQLLELVYLGSMNGEFAHLTDDAVSRVQAERIASAGPAEFRPFADSSRDEAADQARQTAEAVADALSRGRFGGA
jgi:hypothetical protein